MKRNTLLCAVPIMLVASLLTICLSSVGWASRADKINSLSDCIAKADIIVLGFVDAKADQGDSGVIRARLLAAPLKGKIELNEIPITDRTFRSNYGGSPEGPIVVRQQEAYIFFLADSLNHQYHLFNSYDGVIQASGPVLTEIKNQMQKQ